MAAAAERMTITDEDVRARIAAVPHWYHRIEVRPGIMTPGANDPRSLLEMLDLPADCRGMRALDLGTQSGFLPIERQDGRPQ
jgi:tRNA (mo5U34)-methyltransferase